MIKEKIEETLEWISYYGPKVVVIIFLIFFLWLCNPKRIEEIGECGISQELFEECRTMANSDDFEKAHTLLSKILNEYSGSSSFRCEEKVRDITEHVYKKELNFLAAQNKKEYDARMLFLIQDFPLYGTDSEDYEYKRWFKARNKVWNHALNLAKINENEDLAKKIERLLENSKKHINNRMNL